MILGILIQYMYIHAEMYIIKIKRRVRGYKGFIESYIK